MCRRCAGSYKFLFPEQLLLPTEHLMCQKNPRARKIFVRNSGVGNGCTNFMDTWKKIGQDQKGYPQKGYPRIGQISPILGHLIEQFLREISRNRPDHGYPFCRYPFGSCRKMRPFCRKNHVHKIPRLGGGVFWVLGGGGECRFYFYGREDFSECGGFCPTL